MQGSSDQRDRRRGGENEVDDHEEYQPTACHVESHPEEVDGSHEVPRRHIKGFLIEVTRENLSSSAVCFCFPIFYGVRQLLLFHILKIRKAFAQVSKL